MTGDLLFQASELLCLCKRWSRSKLLNCLYIFHSFKYVKLKLVFPQVLYQAFRSAWSEIPCSITFLVLQSGRCQTKSNPGREALVRTKEWIETWFSLFFLWSQMQWPSLQAGMEGLGCKSLLALYDLHAYNISSSTMLV